MRKKAMRQKVVAGHVSCVGGLEFTVPPRPLPPPLHPLAPHQDYQALLARAGGSKAPRKEPHRYARREALKI